MDVRVGLWRKKAEHRRIGAFELRCWRRLLRVPWTARRANQSFLKEISPYIHWKDWCWSWRSNTLAWCEELAHWKSPWCWERLKAGEGDDTGWDGWMASLTQWTWVWVNSESWWWTGRPGVLWFMRLQRVGHSWATELNWDPALGYQDSFPCFYNFLYMFFCWESCLQPSPLPKYIWNIFFQWVSFTE